MAMQNKIIIRPCTRVYLLLLSLTLVTWSLSRSQYTGTNIALSVLSLALIKGVLIGDYFMGLKQVRSLWRWSVIIWLLLPGCMISWAFLTI